MTASIPLFEYDPAKQVSGSMYRLFQQWREYVYEHFLPSNESGSIHHVRQALDYHLSTIQKPLDHATFENWCCVVNESRLAFKPRNFMGTYLRRFYEVSEKTSEDKRVIQAFLNSCTDNKDDLDFVSFRLDNYDVFDQFFKDDVYPVVDMFFETAWATNNPKSTKIFNYFANYVYSSSFVENYPNFNTTKFINKTEVLLPQIEQIMRSTFSTDLARFEFMLSVLYVADNIIDEYNPKINMGYQLLLKTSKEVKEGMHKLFKDSYPEQYKQYQLLNSLGVPMKPCELVSQLQIGDGTGCVCLPEL